VRPAPLKEGWLHTISAPSLGRSRPGSAAFGASRRKKAVRSVVNERGHLVARYRKPGRSSFLPSSHDLELTRRRSQMRVQAEKGGRLSRPLSAQQQRQRQETMGLIASMGQQGLGRRDGYRTRPSTPDSIFETAATGPKGQRRSLLSRGGRGRPASRGRAPHPSDLSVKPAADLISARDTAVWVGAIPHEYHEADVQRAMEVFGEVAAVSMRRKSGRPNWGFVLFQVGIWGPAICPPFARHLHSHPD
jgi:hypothetical protein